MITIYTDGSSKGNPGPGGWGAIILDAKNTKEIGGGEKHTTNNRMELTAAIRALESIADVDESIEINTDSKYVMMGITEWIHGWERNGWKTAAKKPVENQDLWQVLSHNVDGKNIEWRFVKGHAGDTANERCDEIATAFADGVGIDLYDGARNKYPLDLGVEEA
ncbi:ribonuclease HI [Candidatus Parcubacteria bacterium]|nr:ribonuclease HI [Candidatus Parcubacteria bacterium]